MASIELAAAVTGAIGAVAGGGIAWRNHAQDIARQRTNDIRTVLIQLIELRESFALLQSNQSAEFETLSGALNQKRGLYLAIAGTLAVRGARSLSFQDYLILGQESQDVLNYAAALRYFMQAEKLSRSETAAEQAWVLRQLAAYYYLAAPHRNLQRADEFYRQAVAKTEDEPDRYLAYITGLTYEWWAGSALSVGHENDYRDRLEHAKRLYRESGGQEGRRALERLASQEAQEVDSPPPLTDTPIALSEQTPPNGAPPRPPLGGSELRRTPESPPPATPTG